MTGQLETLNIEAESRQDRERAEKDLAAKEHEIENILATHQDMIKCHLGSMPAPGGHGKALSKHLAEKRKIIKEQNDELTKRQKSLIQVLLYKYCIFI